jgi:hypothetical protein
MVTFLHTEAWGDVSRNVGVPLLIPARHMSNLNVRKFILKDKL